MLIQRSLCEGIGRHDGLRKHADRDALLYVSRAIQQQALQPQVRHLGPGVCSVRDGSSQSRLRRHQVGSAEPGTRFGPAKINFVLAGSFPPCTTLLLLVIVHANSACILLLNVRLLHLTHGRRIFPLAFLLVLTRNSSFRQPTSLARVTGPSGKNKTNVLGRKKTETKNLRKRRAPRLIVQECIAPNNYCDWTNMSATMTVLVRVALTHACMRVRKLGTGTSRTAASTDSPNASPRGGTRRYTSSTAETCAT